MVRDYRDVRPHRVVSIGPAWAGNAVNAQPYRCHGLLSRAGFQTGAFYDAAGDVVVFRRRSGAASLLEIQRIPVGQKPFDAHYSISLGLDRRNRIHLVFGAHAGAPSYIRSHSDSLAKGFEEAAGISGRHESRFTYPMFFEDPLSEDLAMLYRDGHSVEGSIRVKRFHSDSKSWTDDTEPLVTGSLAPNIRRGPYVNTPVSAPGGVNHLFLLWRLPPNEAGRGRVVNDGIDLLASRDGWRSLIAIDGTALTRPVSPLNAQRVWAISRDSATINQSGAADDAQGFPAGVFWWRDERKIPQINILRFESRAWRADRASDFTTHFDLNGAGTLRLPHSRPVLVSHASGAFICLFRSIERGGGLAAHVLRPPHYDLDTMGRVNLISSDLGGYEPVFDPGALAEGRLSMYLQRCEFAADDTMASVAQAAASWLADWSLDEIVDAAVDHGQVGRDIRGSEIGSAMERPELLSSGAPNGVDQLTRHRPLFALQASARNLTMRIPFIRNRERQKLAAQGVFGSECYRPRHPDAPELRVPASLSIPRAGLGGRIAIYTAISDDHDSLRPPARQEAGVDYICFTDRPRSGYGIFQIEAMDYLDHDPVRTARYVKTHPHIYLPGYDYAIWMGANIAFAGSIHDYVAKLIRSGLSFGAAYHPQRDCIYEEAEACRRFGKDHAARIDRQMDRYRREGFPRHGGLIESNFFLCRPSDPALGPCFDLWWKEIDNGSRCDRLSLTYALAKLGMPVCPLFDHGLSLRNHVGFTFHAHGTAAPDGLPVAGILRELTTDPHAGIPYARLRKDRIAAQAARRIDVVVCVHGALDYVAPCLNSIRASMAGHHRLIVIDDGSDAATQRYLEATAAAEPRMNLHRNAAAAGYTKACNLGLAMTTGEFVVLLNSDTIVSGNWLLKLADAAFSVPGVGIVGPLSNAASHQSIPNHLGTAENTAINPLPPGVSLHDMDRHCESWTLGPVLPRVPLVHGFCLGIRREVIDAIGLMDEESFPRGYGEENDYCFRASDAGFGLVVATHCFVYHAKSKSYAPSDRRALQRQAGKQLAAKYGKDRVARAIATTKNNPLLQRMRDLAQVLYEEPPGASPG